MPQSHTFSARLMSIYYSLSQYPILSGRIRARMRKELFTRGVISPKTFEEQVRRLAIESQLREGLRNPYADEPGEVWEMRLNRVRDQHTDEVFSQHLSSELFEQLVKEVLHERGMDFERSLIGMNVELAPLDLVFEQAAAIERLPEDEREPYGARLEEIKVVLIRSMISDQLRYINIAKEWFTISDLADIRMRKIGAGRIGGKAAGMLLAARILHNSADAVVRGCVNVPESYFIGADELYTFMSLNDLFHWNDQKYKTEKEMRAEFPKIQEDFEHGQFPPDIVERLTEMLSNLGNRPLIVRSSSLLEDNFGTSFAGKYESIFLPNQRSLMENVEDMLRAVKRIYASTLNPNALLYRRSRGLQDYDERMAILIQAVQGEPFGRYFMPQFAGVAFSRNLYRWAPQIRREDGFVRLVWGLGTRAVDRVGNDYPRLIALSHPTLRPSNDPRQVRRYSQQYVDLLDLQDNEFKTLPVHDVINSEYPALRFLAQLDEGGYYTTMHSRIVDDVNQLVLTFDGVLRRTPFADRMRSILSILEEAYRAPVDMEFTLQLQEPENSRSDLCLFILQCRPQAQIAATEQVTLPSDLELRDVIFSTNFMVPQGRVDRIEYVLFVPPEGYFRLPTQNERALLARAVGTLNAALHERTFICVGPGRWGSSNSDLGVPIDYGDIYNASALVELAGQGIGLPPEPSLGTHFFQDLLEAQIYPLAIYLDDPQAGFNRDFFYSTPNRAGDWFHLDDALRDSLRLIRVADYRPGHHMRLVMSDEKGTAVAYLRPDRT